MDAVILAGGRGKRLRPFTDTMPKPLLAVRGKPLLEWTLRALRPVAERVLVVAAYRQEQISAFMESQRIFSQYQVIEQTPEPLGTGHALLCCASALQTPDFLALNGDDLYSTRALRALAQVNLGLLTVERDDPARWAVVVTDDHGRVTRLHEKPPDGLYPIPVRANTGAYKLNRAIFDYDLPLSERGEYEITDYVTYLAQRRVVLPVAADFWVTVGTPEDYSAVQSLDLEALLFA